MLLGIDIPYTGTIHLSTLTIHVKVPKMYTLWGIRHEARLTLQTHTYNPQVDITDLHI